MLTTIAATLRRLYEREVPVDDTVWHKWNTMGLPVLTIDRSFAAGPVWRRKKHGRWQYQNRPDSDDEWEARQW